MGCIAFIFLSFIPLFIFLGYDNMLLIIPFFLFVIVMLPRRSARVARGRARGRGGGRGHGRNNEEVNQNVGAENNVDGEVAEQSAARVVAAANVAPVVPVMIFTKWTSLQVGKFDGAGSPTDAAD